MREKLILMLLFVVIVVVLKYNYLLHKQQTLGIEDMGHFTPFLTMQNEILIPNSYGEFDIPFGAWMTFMCAVAFAEPYRRYGQTLDAQYAGSKCFLISDEIVHLKDINGTTISMPKPIRMGYHFNGGAVWLKFGIIINDSLSLAKMEVCFDEIRQTTLYALHTIYPGSIYYKHGVKGKNFSSDDFFGGRNVDMFYERKRQIKTLSRILGKDVSNYVTDKNYLSRGHLVAKADMIFSGQQKSTFHFVNVAPQWQSFNNGNWSHIEDGVRKFAHDNKATLLCWTGTWGICTLADVNNVQRELYLIYDEQNNTRKLPVPKLHYRIVIDTESRKGIVLVGVNNPYLTIEEINNGEYVIAEDVSHNINWIDWDRQNIDKGYCYACSVPDFVAVVKDLPLDMLETKGVLGLEELPI